MGRRVTGVDIDRWSSYRPDAWWKVRIGIALRRSTHWRFMRGASWYVVPRRCLAYIFTHPLVPIMDCMHRGKSALAWAGRRSTHWRFMRGDLWCASASSHTHLTCVLEGPVLGGEVDVSNDLPGIRPHSDLHHHDLQLQVMVWRFIQGNTVE